MEAIKLIIEYFMCVTLIIQYFVSSHPSCGQTQIENISQTYGKQAGSTMALDQFIGKWLEEKKEGFHYLADALAESEPKMAKTASLHGASSKKTTGLSAEQRAFFEHSQSELSYSRKGDTWSIQVGIVGVPQSTTFTFKLGETYNSQNIDGSPLMSVIHQDGARLVERHESTGGRNFVMNITRETNGDTMNATTTIGGVSMQTIYKRS